MEKLCLGGAALLIVFAMGYVTMSAYTRNTRVDLWEKLYLSLVCFFFSVLVVGVCNILTGGVILSTRVNFLWVVLVFFVGHAIAGYGVIKKDLARLEMIRVGQDFSWPKFCFVSARLAVLCLLLLGVVYMAVRPLIPEVILGGDFKRHIMFASQLLNGFPFAHHLPYRGISHMGSSYPFLPHVAMAYFVRLLNVNVLDAYFILQMLQALLLPAGMFVLVYKLTNHNYWMGIFGIVLCTLYGGYSSEWQQVSWWFNPALQRLMPQHFTRMLSLGILLAFLSVRVHSSGDENTGVSQLFQGVILGIIGLCHTYAYAFALCFVVVGTFWAGHAEDVKKNALILAVGLGIAMLGYIPSMASIIANFTVGPADYFEKPSLLFFSRPMGQVFLTGQRFLTHYGAVGVCGVISFCFIKKFNYTGFYQGLLLTVLVILILTWSKEMVSVFLQVSLPYHPTQQKFGKLIFLVLVVLSCTLIHKGFGWVNTIKGTKKIIPGSLILILLAGALQPGIFTTFEFMKNERLRGQDARFSSFSDTTNIAHAAGKILTREDVVAVPFEFKSDFTCFTGINTLILDHPKAHSFSREFARKILYADRQGRKRIEALSSLPYPLVFKRILDQYQITCIIVSQKNRLLYDPFGFLEYSCQGRWEKAGEYVMFRVDRQKMVQTPDPVQRERFHEFFRSKENFNSTMGFFPLVRNRYVRPGLLDSRGLKAVGLTWDGTGFWIGYEKKRKLYKIDPETGRIMQTLDFPSARPGPMAWDGLALWVVDRDEKKIVQVNVRTGRVMDSVFLSGLLPRAMEWYGDLLWLADVQNENGTYRAGVVQLDTKTGLKKSGFECPDWPMGIAAGKRLFVSSGSNSISAYSLKDQALNPTHFKNGSLNPTVLAMGDTGVWCFDERTSSLVEFKGLK